MGKIEYKKFNEYQKVLEYEERLRVLRKEIEELQVAKKNYLQSVIESKIEKVLGIKKGDYIRVEKKLGSIIAQVLTIEGFYKGVTFMGCAYLNIYKPNKKGEMSKAVYSMGTVPCLDLDDFKVEVLGHMKEFDKHYNSK